MGKTWREWGVERQERSLRKDRDDWRREYEKEKSVSGVFIVVNEWVDSHSGSGMEILDGLYYRTFDAAWERLSEAADLKKVEIETDDTGFTLDDQGTITYEEFYIQELEVN